MKNSSPVKKEDTGNFLFTTIKAGVLVILPITLFIVLLALIINFMVGLLVPFKNLFGLDSANGQWLINIIAFIFLIGLLFLAGLVVQSNDGKQFFERVERKFFSQLPMYTGIKDTVRQFIGTKRTPFQQVVSVNVFNNSTRMIGFVTDEMDNDFFSVFVPTGPNPTNGFIFCVNRDQLEFLDVKPDAAMRMIIGVGTGASNLFNVKEDILEESS